MVEGSNGDENERMQDARTVARRILALTVFGFRAAYEDHFSRESMERQRSCHEEVEDMLSFLNETGLIDSLSDIERALFGKKLGTWHSRDVLECSWKGENLLALLWAIKWIDELPPIHQQSMEVHSDVESELDRWEDFVAEVELRSEEEIQTVDRYIEAVRLREETPDDFEGLAWLANKFRTFGGGASTDGDLTIDGVPFRKLDKQARQDVRSIALERHRALRWVLRYEVDLDAPAPSLR